MRKQATTHLPRGVPKYCIIHFRHQMLYEGGRNVGFLDFHATLGGDHLWPQTWAMQRGAGGAQQTPPQLHIVHTFRGKLGTPESRHVCAMQQETRQQGNDVNTGQVHSMGAAHTLAHASITTTQGT